ncbi:d(CMP) kinase [uncultured Planktomarina sp.]|uniref:(d)CMP kinase n=1 Tax=uncultured Planktomarina sp. TaxID=1538529 RepID=UPI003261B294
MSFTIAIDGPAAAGKGTISKAVAAHFAMAHLDTGLLYRAVGAQMLQGADPLVAAQSLRPEDLDAANLRSPEVALAASQVAVMAEVRAELLAFQRGFARREGGAVLDGRDIGTVICPKAEVKLFVTASAEVRARRRHQELVAGGTQIDFDQVLADVTTRDARDAERAESPMIAAVDAVMIDTSNLTINAAIAVAVSIVQEGIIS